MTIGHILFGEVPGGNWDMAAYMGWKCGFRGIGPENSREENLVVFGNGRTNANFVLTNQIKMERKLGQIHAIPKGIGD